MSSIGDYLVTEGYSPLLSANAVTGCIIGVDLCIAPTALDTEFGSQTSIFQMLVVTVI